MRWHSACGSDLGRPMRQLACDLGRSNFCKSIGRPTLRAMVRCTLHVSATLYIYSYNKQGMGLNPEINQRPDLSQYKSND